MKTISPDDFYTALQPTLASSRFIFTTTTAVQPWNVIDSRYNRMSKLFANGAHHTFLCYPHDSNVCAPTPTLGFKIYTNAGPREGAIFKSISHFHIKETRSAILRGLLHIAHLLFHIDVVEDRKLDHSLTVFLTKVDATTPIDANSGKVEPTRESSHYVSDEPKIQTLPAPNDESGKRPSAVTSLAIMTGDDLAASPLSGHWILGSSQT